MERGNTGTRDTDVLSQTEAAVAAIWAQELQRAVPVLSGDNFFALGGDSLTMMLVLFRVNEELGVELPPAALLESPELRAFCSLIDDARRASVGKAHAVT